MITTAEPDINFETSCTSLFKFMFFFFKFRRKFNKNHPFNQQCKFRKTPAVIKNFIANSPTSQSFFYCFTSTTKEICVISNIFLFVYAWSGIKNWECEERNIFQDFTFQRQLHALSWKTKAALISSWLYTRVLCQETTSRWGVESRDRYKKGNL